MSNSLAWTTLLEVITNRKFMPVIDTNLCPLGRRAETNFAAPGFYLSIDFLLVSICLSTIGDEVFAYCDDPCRVCVSASKFHS